MAKDKAMSMCCCESHMRKKGVCMLIVGLVVIANAYSAFVSWWMLVGILIALGGLWKAIAPVTPCK